MNEPDNIICFDRAVVHILGRLYQQFPRREAVLDPKEWQDESPIPEECREDYPLRRNLYSETLHWLIDEGFLRCDARNGVFQDVRLTSRGLLLLRQTPESENEKPRDQRASFGSLFSEAVAKEGAKQLASRAWSFVGEFLSVLQ